MYSKFLFPGWSCYLLTAEMQTLQQEAGRQEEESRQFTFKYGINVLANRKNYWLYFEI